MIKSFTVPEGFGVYSCFRWDSRTPEFNKFNLVYGLNGSGKSTLARMLRYVESGVRPEQGRFVVKTEDGRLDSQALEQAGLPIRVFNQDFVREAIFTEEGEVAPILVLGPENVDRKKRRDGLSKERMNRSETRGKLDDEIDKLGKSLGKLAADNAKKIKEYLRSSEHSTYNYYNQANYKKRVEELCQLDREEWFLDEQERHRCEGLRKDQKRDELPPVVPPRQGLVDLAESIDKILARTVVVSVLEGIEDDSELSPWLRKGLLLHRDREEDTRCLFCSSPLPAERLKELESHFNDEYEKAMAEIEGALSALKDRLKKLEDPGFQFDRDRAKLYEDFRDESDQAWKQYRHAVERQREYVEQMREQLERKRHSPFNRFGPVDDPTDADKALERGLSRLERVIGQHNDRVRSHEEAVTEAREKLERHWVGESLESYLLTERNIQAKRDELGPIKSRLEKLDEEIAELERELQDHRQPAAQLNDDLKSYLGRDDLTFEVEGDGYRIRRNGQPAQGLSEGEKTALALLYFLRRLDDKSFDRSRGVVVLDDPVSSLDQHALFAAYSFIRSEAVKEMGQLFILTHSFLFFRYVRDWLRGENGDGRAALYLLVCGPNSEGRRSAKLHDLPEVLRKYHSEYHFLFQQIHRASSREEGDFQADFGLPNLARRLLEIFYSFWRPTKSKLNTHLDHSDFDRERLIRIRSYLNTFSHGEGFEPLGDRELSLLSESPEVLRDVLALIEHESKEHYEEMLKAVREPS